MEEFSENKFQTMVDEMNRFEEEIGMPYVPDMDHPNIMTSQPFVLGTNTFNQAQQKILKINQTADGIPAEPPVFVPHQVLQRPQTNAIPDAIPPPPPPPLSMPPAGMTFPPRMPMPYSQPIPPPPQPPGFGPPLIMRPDGIPAPSSIPAAPTITFPRRAPTPWTGRSTFRPAGVTKSETTSKPSDQPPKVVVSATPKLYTSKLDQAEEITSSSSRVSAMESSKSINYNDVRFGNKKPTNIEPSKFTLPASTSSTTDPFSQTANKKKDKKQKKMIRVSGGQTWEDPTLGEWEEGDFRLFAGDLGNDVTDELLTRIFSKYPSFIKARVVRDKRTNKTKGFGFISFKDPQDFIKASKEMNGRYVGSRPIKLRKSTWRNRNLDTVKKKEKEKAALIALLTGK